MALPLPRVVADVGPGGPLVTTMNALNSLTNNKHLSEINRVKSQYAPMTTQAEAASKLAYANYIAPQFIAKIMQNPSFMANLTEEQKNNLKNLVYSAPTKNNPGLNAINNMPAPTQDNSQTFTGVGQPSTNSISGSFVNGLKNLLGLFGTGNKENNALTQSPQTNGFSQPNQNNSNPASNESERPENILGNNPRIVEAWRQSPEGRGKIITEGENYIPDEEELRNWYRSEANKPSTTIDMTGGHPDARGKTWAEKEAEQKGIVEEGGETGKIRAKQREELDDQYQQALQSEVPMQHLNELITNPIFQKLRRDGAFQKLQLDAKSIIGTPEEKSLIADFQTTALKAVAETVMGFKGRILDKEVSLAQDMKISPKDSIQAMLGKLPTIETFNEMTKERARIASKLMRDQHISKGDALEEADKRVNGKEIRKRVEKELNIGQKPESSFSKPDFKKMSIEQLRSYIGE